MNEPLQCTTGIAALDQEVEYTQDGNATVCPTPAEYTSVSDEVEDDIIGQLVDERFLIQLQGSDDPRDPQTWSPTKKVCHAAMMTAATLFAGMSSAVLEGGIGASIQQQFNVGEPAAIFTGTIFVVGFALGPLVFGPLSELAGRKNPLIFGIVLSSLFQILCAVPPNYASLLVGRFLAGVFGSAPYAIGGGFFHDVFDNVHVQAGIGCFAVATAGGPAWGPVVGGALAGTSESYGWRWASWCMVCFGLLVALVLSLFFEETFVPAILANDAKRQRHETGNWAWHSAVDRIRIRPKDVVSRYLLRPLKMLITEPMLLVISIYMSFVYALLYMLMAALPLIYHTYRGFDAVSAELPLVAVFVGILAGGAIIIFDMHRYAKVLRDTPERGVPEQRFFPMGLGALLLPIGLFWFAFTGPALVASAWPSIVALAVSMCGMVLIFECGIIYLIDMYGQFANSAIAANTIMRSLVGGGFPLFTPAMVRGLGWQSTWAMLLLACVAVLLAPIPVVFYRLGARLRSMSKFRVTL